MTAAQNGTSPDREQEQAGALEACRYCIAIDVPEACEPAHHWPTVQSLAEAFYEWAPLTNETPEWGRDHQIGGGFIQDAVVVVADIQHALDADSEFYDEWNPDWTIENRDEVPQGIRFAVNGIEYLVRVGEEGFVTPELWTIEEAIEGWW